MGRLSFPDGKCFCCYMSPGGEVRGHAAARGTVYCNSRKLAGSADVSRSHRSQLFGLRIDVLLTNVLRLQQHDNFESHLVIQERTLANYV